MKKMYHHPWFPRFFHKKFDGGKESGVTGYFLIEWKKVFSIGLLRFNEGSREAFHSHAFNAITWWLTGSVMEIVYGDKNYRFKPSLVPKITKKDSVHKVYAHETTWALTFRGPWSDTWFEIDPQGNKTTMTHGRVICQ